MADCGALWVAPGRYAMTSRHLARQWLRSRVDPLKARDSPGLVGGSRGPLRSFLRDFRSFYRGFPSDPFGFQKNRQFFGGAADGVRTK
jgi:hypothetical protein